MSAEAEEVLRECPADICVIGEGEVTFSELIQNLEDLPVQLPSIDGIAYRDGEKYVENAPRKLIDDIDFVPLPARDLVHDEDYVGLSHRRGKPNAEMIIMRGCPYRCVFCANPVFRVHSGVTYRTRSPESIAVEAEALYQRGYRELYLHSDELNVEHDWAVSVCKALADLGHPDLYFQCNLRVLPISEELAYWLRRANFWMVRFGIESASQRVLRSTKKKMASEETLRACEIMSAAGIKVWGYFLMFQFWENEREFGWETVKEVEQTIIFARDLFKKGLLHYSSWMYAIPVEGSELHRIAKRNGMFENHYGPIEAWDPSAHLPGVTKRDFHRVFNQSRRLQARMAIRSGFFELRNWKSLLRKARTMFPGQFRS